MCSFTVPTAVRMSTSSLALLFLFCVFHETESFSGGLWVGIRQYGAARHIQDASMLHPVASVQSAGRRIRVGALGLRASEMKSRSDGIQVKFGYEEARESNEYGACRTNPLGNPLMVARMIRQYHNNSTRTIAVALNATASLSVAGFDHQNSGKASAETLHRILVCEVLQREIQQAGQLRQMRSRVSRAYGTNQLAQSLPEFETLQVLLKKLADPDVSEDGGPVELQQLLGYAKAIIADKHRIERRALQPLIATACLDSMAMACKETQQSQATVQTIKKWLLSYSNNLVDDDKATSSKEGLLFCSFTQICIKSKMKNIRGLASCVQKKVRTDEVLSAMHEELRILSLAAESRRLVYESILVPELMTLHPGVMTLLQHFAWVDNSLSTLRWTASLSRDKCPINPFPRKNYQELVDLVEQLDAFLQEHLEFENKQLLPLLTYQVMINKMDQMAGNPVTRSSPIMRAEFQNIAARFKFMAGTQDPSMRSQIKTESFATMSEIRLEGPNISSHVANHNVSWTSDIRGGPKARLESLVALATSRGGQCLSTEYTGMKQRMTWSCKQGHVWDASAENVLRGSWCKACSVQSTRLTIEDMQQTAKTHGGRCLSTEYVNTRTKLLWECSEGHLFWMAPNNIRRPPNSARPPSWCPSCGRNSKANRSSKPRNKLPHQVKRSSISSRFRRFEGPTTYGSVLGEAVSSNSRQQIINCTKV